MEQGRPPPSPGGHQIDTQSSLALALLPSLSVQGLPSFSLSQILSDEAIQNAIDDLPAGMVTEIMGDKRDAGAASGDGAAPSAIPQLLRRLSVNLLQGTVYNTDTGTCRGSLERVRNGH